MQNTPNYRVRLIALLALPPLLAGCSNTADLLSKDAEWFSRPGRVFARSISIDAPPLSPEKPVTPDDLVTADGACPGMAPAAGPADANASTGPATPTGGAVALGHTECDVVRGIGAPDSVNIGNGPRGERQVVINWSKGARAGIYTFNAGRLTSVERGPEVEAPPRIAKPKGKKRATG